jgi:hypothetical protein
MLASPSLGRVRYEVTGQGVDKSSLPPRQLGQRQLEQLTYTSFFRVDAKFLYAKFLQHVNNMPLFCIVQ